MSAISAKLISIAKSVEPRGGYVGYIDLIDALEADPDSLASFKSTFASAKPEELDNVAESDEPYGWIVMGAADALDLLPDDPRNFLSEDAATAVPDHEAIGALCSACILNDKATVARLVKRVDVNALNHNQQAPLSYAIGNNHPDCVRVLLNHGADPNLVQNWGNTQMHVCASTVSSKSIFAMLVEAGGDLTATNGDGKTVTDLLAEYGRRDWAAG